MLKSGQAELVRGLACELSELNRSNSGGFWIFLKIYLSRDPLQEKNIFFRIQTSQLYRNDPQHSLTIFDFLGEK